MASVTMADVAKLAGVSKSTVSQFLNKRYHYMSEETKSRIEQAIHELGYSPNAVARSLRQKKTQTIGVIVANILHSFSTEVIRAIEDTCHAYDVHVIVCNADNDPQKEKKYVEMLRAKQVDGLIVFPTSDNKELFNGLVAAHFPLVFIDRLIHGVPVNAVLADNEEAMRLAVNALAESGRRRIGLVLPPLLEEITPRMERRDGFMKAISEAGLEYEEAYVAAGQVEEAPHFLADMLALPTPPDAVIAGNDLVLYELLRSIKQQKIDVPEQIALIGIDDVTFADFFNPSITTVAQPTFAMGHKAAELLLQEINGGKKHSEIRTHRFQPTLKCRQSC